MSWPIPEKDFCIYILKCPYSGVIRYVGQTTWGKTRIQNHWKDFRLNKNGKLIRVKAWIKSLKNKNTPFLVEYIDYAETKEELNQKEIYWIKFYKNQGLDLLNANEGGNSKGQIVTQEQKIKLSEISKNLHKNPEYREKFLKGQKTRYFPKNYKPRSEETKKIHANTDYINARKVRIEDNNGVIYNSIKECAEKLNCSSANVSRALNTGGFIRGLKVKKLNNPKTKQEKKLRGNKPFIDNNGVIYQTQDEAAKKLNLNKRTILRLLKKQNKSKIGLELNYVITEHYS